MRQKTATEMQTTKLPLLSERGISLLFLFQLAEHLQELKETQITGKQKTNKK